MVTTGTQTPLTGEVVSKMVRGADVYLNQMANPIQLRFLAKDLENQGESEIQSPVIYDRNGAGEQVEETVQKIDLSINSEEDITASGVDLDTSWTLESELSIAPIREQPAPVQEDELEQLAKKANLLCLEDNLMASFPAVQKLMNRPGRHRAALHKKMLLTVQDYLTIRDVDVKSVLEEEWLMLLIRFADNKGRCQYGDGKTGISPSTAARYTNVLASVLEQMVGARVSTFWPDFRLIKTLWARDLSRVKLYQRKHADYWTMEKLKKYLQAADDTVVLEAGQTALAYYARKGSSSFF